MGADADLLFSWTGYHDVWEMASESAYEACDFSGGAYLGAATGVAVDARPGETAFYSCSVGAHCIAGQKVAVTWDAPLATPAPSKRPTPAPTPPPTPRPTSSPTEPRPTRADAAAVQEADDESADAITDVTAALVAADDGAAVAATVRGAVVPADGAARPPNRRRRGPRPSDGPSILRAVDGAVGRAQQASHAVALAGTDARADARARRSVRRARLRANAAAHGESDHADPDDGVAHGQARARADGEPRRGHRGPVAEARAEPDGRADGEPRRAGSPSARRRGVAPTREARAGEELRLGRQLPRGPLRGQGRRGPGLAGLPGARGACPYECAGDSASWHKNGHGEKDCDWVSGFYYNRASACPAACGS
ncbi:hypothetical protein SO694_00036255 [Aureococcus anophagefferens]|uniref:Phytocyanin domain-containing protein n=1 Tax=Aureococcus anophagefferens TaxID=44056 RepID=A0ABR1FLB9_AURAN